MNLLLIVLIAFVLRIIGLNQSFWLDEAINVSNVRDRGVIDLVTNYSLGDFHPPLYHLLLKCWFSVFGSSEVSARMLSVVFGVGTVWVTFQIAKFFFKKQKWQLLSSVLVATSGLQIYYSQESRMYMVACFLSCLSIWRLLCLKKATRHKLLQKVFLVISLSLLLLSDYVPWLLWPVFFILAPGVSIVALLLTAPWWPFFYQQLQIGLTTASAFPGWNQVVGGISIKNIALLPVKFLIGRVSLEPNWLYGLVLLFPLVTALYLVLVAVKKAKKNQIRLLLVWLCTPIVLGIVLSFKISLLSYFRFLFVVPALYLLLVFGVSKTNTYFQKILVAVLIAVNVISATSYLFMPRFHRENWKGLSLWIDQVAKDTTAVAVIPSLAQADPYQYYQHTVPIRDDVEFTQLPETIFLIRYVQEIFDPNDSQRTTIESLGYQKLAERSFNGVVVWVYQRTQVFASSFQQY